MIPLLGGMFQGSHPMNKSIMQKEQSNMTDSPLTSMQGASSFNTLGFGSIAVILRDRLPWMAYVKIGGTHAGRIKLDFSEK